jgi:hypothetical protein
MTKAKIDPENPPMDFRKTRFAVGETKEERYANALKAIDTARGRPRKGSKSPGSRAKSLRLPDATWADLDALAKAKKTTVHRLLRVLIAKGLYTSTLHEQGPRKTVKIERARTRSKAHKAA